MSHEPITIELNPKDPQSVERALRTEWLLTNGLGGYAMGTILGVNTRRYHGLLIGATKPPVGRIVALHSMIEQFQDGDEIIDLSTQQFGHDLTLHPGGWRQLKQVAVLPNERVEWVYQVGRWRIAKSLSMLAGRNAAMLQYVISGGTSAAKLRLRPFTPMRDFHGLLQELLPPCTAQVQADGVLQFRCDDVQLRWFGQTHNWRDDPQWWRQFAYVHDRTRGQDWREDQWSAGYIECDVARGSETRLSFALALHSHGGGTSLAGPKAPPLAPGSAGGAAERRFPPMLARAADQFVVWRKVRPDWFSSIIAGYPWFGDWGRDTMIALPGLMLCTGRIEEARSTLLAFARHLHNGLIPNVFDDYGAAAHYNSVDASLWFVHAVHEWWRAQRAERAAELVAACRDIVKAYRAGSDFNIRRDDDGLITAGDETTQLTWMDAKRDGVVFTQRHGKAVEINALWFNALNCVAEMTEDESERAELRALSRQAAEAFRREFWWEERQCLYDVLGRSHIRPNQVFAVSLPFSPLEKDQQRAVVKIIGDRLLTPFGLRTLDREDPEYRGRYEGNLFERDRAYHNGTVWPWLIGPYCEALLRVDDFSAAAKRKVRKIIQPLLDEMTNFEGGRCIGQIAEVYDGDPPHRPGGCPAQAWSVAEVLRILTLV